MVSSKPAEILLVDDTESSVTLVRQALNVHNHGVRLHVVKHGKDALDYLFKRSDYAQAPRPDLVLLGLAGRQSKHVLAETKGNFALCDIPIIVINGVTDPADHSDAWSLHANCYIEKPDDETEYSSVLQSVLDFWLNVARLPVVH